MPEPAAPAAPPSTTTETPPGTPATPATPASPPAWATGVPAKLLRDTPEATIAELTKAHSALESTLGKSSRPAPSPAKAPEGGLQIPTTPETPAAAEVPETSTFEDVVKAGKIDTVALTTEVMTNGKPTAEQRAAIKKAWADTRGGKLTDADIDLYLGAQAANLRTQTAAQVSAAVEFAGGKDRMNEHMQWAAKNLTDAEKADFNGQLANPATVLAATQRLVGLRAARSGGSPIAGDSAPGPNTSGFTTKTEMHAAQKASRAKYGDWAQDPAFMARLRNTPKNVKEGI